MNYILLKDYINKLNKEKLNELMITNNFYLNNNELDIIYKYIKEKYLDFIKNPDIIISKIKEKITQENYLKLLNIYNQYKEIIKTYFP